MKKAFTLIELLVVIGLMGFLGTISVGGYRAMQRGMAERGVMDNVNAFIRAAYQRAQIDRQPTAIYYWNETLRQAGDDQTEIVVGKAVAIRRHGRITHVLGQYLYDEFADLNLSYSTNATSAGLASTMYLYPIDRLSSTQFSRSIVGSQVVAKNLTPQYLSGLVRQDANGTTSQPSAPPGETLGRLRTYAFEVEDAGGVSWTAGMAYGFEFARLELPHGFIFGSSYSTAVTDPIRTVGTATFTVGLNSGAGVGSSGRGTYTPITVSELVPDTSGNLAVRSIGTSTSTLVD